MAADLVFFRDPAYLCLAAFPGGGIIWRASQPLILGHVVGDILISPFTPGPGVERVHPFERFAAIGVILGTDRTPLGGEAALRVSRCVGGESPDADPCTKVGQSSAQTAGVSLLGEGVP